MPRTASIRLTESHAARRRAGRVVLLLLALFAPWPSAIAGQAAGLDIIIAIDQSGSMSKADGALVANDPDGKRVYFLRHLLPVLKEEARNAYTTRMSVVEFGARNDRNPFKRPQVTLSAKTVLPAAPGRDWTLAGQEWKAEFVKIKPVSRGNTDHPRALELVAEELRRFADNPPPVPTGGKEGPRQPVVLLVTDGKPYVDKATPESSLLDESAAVAKRFTQEVKNVRFGVVGLGDLESRYWYSNCLWQGRPGCGKFWQDLATPDKNGAGLAFLATSDKELIDKLYETFGELVGRPVGCGQDQQTIPAYLRGLHVQVDFERPGLPLSALDIRDSQSRPVLPTAAERPDSDGVAFGVPHPQPGLWQLRKSDSPYRVCLDYELEQARLVEPASPAAQGKAAPIRYRLSGRGPGGVFEPLPEFPLRFSVAIQPPSGGVSNVDLRPDDKHPGDIVSTADYLFEETGEYRLNLSGEIAAVGLPQGHAAVYASAEPGGDKIQVERGTPVQIRVETPKPGEVVALRLGRATLPVSLSFTNAQEGTALRPGSVLKPGTALAVQWLPENQGRAEAVPFNPTTLDGNRLRADLAMNPPGWLGYLFSKGRFRVYLQPVDFAQGMVPQGVEGGEDWRSAVYEFEESRWIVWPGLAGMVVLLGLLAWGGRRWLDNGRIRRQHRVETLKPVLQLQFPTDGNLNRPWDVSPSRLTRPPQAKVMLPDQTEWLIEDFSIRRRFVPGMVRIEVRYRPRPQPDGKRSRLEKIELETACNGAERSGSTRNVKGLESFQANFVLLMKEKD